MPKTVVVGNVIDILTHPLTPSKRPAPMADLVDTVLAT